MPRETPLDYMLRVLNEDGADESRRDDMAKTAAPYVHARLSPMEPTGQGTGQSAGQWTGQTGVPIVPVDLSRLTPDDLAELKRLCALLVRSGDDAAADRAGGSSTED